MIKRDISLSEIDKVSDLLSEEKFYLFKGADILDFKNGINWEYQHSHSTATYQVYLHSLDMITYLCNQYKKTKETWLLEKSLKILKSWIEYDYSPKKKPPEKMWYDHPASCRALTISFFYVLSKNILELDEDLVYDCLVKHAQFLHQDENYVQSNHGIMMDRALILLSKLLAHHKDAQEWQDKALMRIREAFNRDFSRMGTHLENSPDYHQLIGNLFRTTEVFLNKNNLTLGEDINQRLKLARRYFQYLAKPDKTLPMLGDSSSISKIRDRKKFDNFIDIQAGIAILQQLHQSNSRFSTWFTFVCGFGSRTHKHHDDLSFNLFWKGKEIFIDSGKYNYDKKNKNRAYITSPLAHNTIAIEGMTYALGDPLKAIKNITITDFTSNPYYDLVKGINMNYKGKKVYRTIIFLKSNIFIIFDKILSNTACKGLQLFNLAPHIEIVDRTDKRILIKSEEESIEIIPMLDVDDIKIYHGDRKTPRAVISQRFAELTDISQIEISKKGKDLEFLTLIKLGEKTPIPEIEHNQKVGQLLIRTNQQELNLVL